MEILSSANSTIDYLISKLDTNIFTRLILLRELRKTKHTMKGALDCTKFVKEK